MLLFFFLIIDLYFLFDAAIAQIFNPTAELVVPIGIQSKETKAGIEIHSVIVEAKIRNFSAKFRVVQTFLHFLLFNSLHLLQIIKRINIFAKRYDILGFSNFLYPPQITQYSFFIFLVTENILVLFYHSSHNY